MLVNKYCDLRLIICRVIINKYYDCTHMKIWGEKIQNLKLKRQKTGENFKISKV